LYDGTDFDRQVCGWQMQEAADEITRLRARVKELEEECRKLDADAANEKAERESWQALASKLEARIAELERFWIPVTESLPPFDVPVWLIDKNKNIWIGARSDSEDGWLWGHCYDGWFYSKGLWLTSRVDTDDNYHPTHWAHLPEPPGVAGG
jgi:FtsZ-binding cell division protein ZapB